MASQDTGAIAPHVLLVEDDKLTRVILRDMLRKCGFQVTLAENGDVALSLLERPKSKTAYTVILTDINMPKVNGAQLLERVQTSPKTRNIPVVVMSSNESPQDSRDMLDAGAADYLIKPVTLQQLAAIKQMVPAVSSETRDSSPSRLASPSPSSDLKASVTPFEANSRVAALFSAALATPPGATSSGDSQDTRDDQAGPAYSSYTSMRSHSRPSTQPADTPAAKRPRRAPPASGPLPTSTCTFAMATRGASHPPAARSTASPTDLSTGPRTARTAHPPLAAGPCAADARTLMTQRSSASAVTPSSPADARWHQTRPGLQSSSPLLTSDTLRATPASASAAPLVAVSTPMGRQAALERFRKKKANRCFVKKVRYQARKELAQQRPRYKGQFIKMDAQVAV